VYSKTQIDPVVSFRNSQGEQVRGTIINLQRKSLVMEIYNPYSIVQVSEVLSELSVRMGAKNAYLGKAVVMSLVNTGLTAVVSLTLIDEWRELTDVNDAPKSVAREAELFVQDWDARFNIRRDYQIVVNEMRAYLSEVSRWVEQVDLTESLPKREGRLREDVFYELATPLMGKVKVYLDWLEDEAQRVDPNWRRSTAPMRRPRCTRCCCARVRLSHVHQAARLCRRLRNGEPDPQRSAAGAHHLLPDRQHGVPEGGRGHRAPQPDRPAGRFPDAPGRTRTCRGPPVPRAQRRLRPRVRDPALCPGVCESGTAVVPARGLQRGDA
jgi:hypothetical protein